MKYILCIVETVSNTRMGQPKSLIKELSGAEVLKCHDALYAICIIGITLQIILISTLPLLYL